MTNIQNLNKPKDAFEQLEEEEGTRQSFVHIRIQQRTGRKTITTVQGLDPIYDFKKIVRFMKKEYSCNGTTVDHKEYGEVIQLTGDQRQNIKDLLCKVGLAKEENIKVHGLLTFLLFENKVIYLIVLLTLFIHLNTVLKYGHKYHFQITVNLKS